MTWDTGLETDQPSIGQHAPPRILDDGVVLDHADASCSCCPDRGGDPFVIGAERGYPREPGVHPVGRQHRLRTVQRPGLPNRTASMPVYPAMTTIPEVTATRGTPPRNRRASGAARTSPDRRNLLPNHCHRVVAA